MNPLFLQKLEQYLIKKKFTSYISLLFSVHGCIPNVLLFSPFYIFNCNGLVYADLAKLLERALYEKTRNKFGFLNKILDIIKIFPFSLYPINKQLVNAIIA